MDELKKNPVEALAQIEELKKRCVYYSENLMKDLLSLDELVGVPDLRPIKKQSVCWLLVSTK